MTQTDSQIIKGFLMLQKYNSLIFSLMIDSLGSFAPCLSLEKLLKRCKESIEQKSQEQAKQWLAQHISCVAYRLRIGPYECELESYHDARELYTAVTQSLREANACFVEKSTEQNVSEMLDLIPRLDAKLKRRIATAILRGLLQDRHLQYYVEVSMKPSTRNPSALCQRIFWQHIAERFPGQEARITIETQIDPFL